MKVPVLPNYGGRSLRLNKAEGILGGKIWPSAWILCQVLGEMAKRNSSRQANFSNCVELGAGTGVVGLYASLTLKIPSTILTDHRPPLAAAMTSVAYNVDGTLEDETTNQKSDRLLHLLDENIALNEDLYNDGGLLLPSVMELDWNNRNHRQAVVAASPSGFELVLASDVTYSSALHQPLAETIACLLAANNRSNNNNACCLIAHEQRLLNLRGVDAHLLSFEDALHQAGLVVTQKSFHQPMSSSSSDTSPHIVCLLCIEHQ